MATSSKKLFSTFLIIVFYVNIFHIVNMPNECHGGTSCTHHSNNEIGGQTYYPYHKHCEGSDCKVCEIEKGISFEIMNPITQGANDLVDDPIYAEETLNDKLYKPQILEEYSLSLQLEVKNKPSPIYVQNCSFLC